MKKLLILLLLSVPLTAQVTISNGVQIGGTTSAATANPYDVSQEFAPGEVLSLQHVEQFTAASATATIEDITGTSGTVTSFQFIACAGVVTTCSGAGFANDAIINIYIDGSGTPSFTFDAGVLGTHFSNSTYAYSTLHTSVGTISGNRIEFNFKYPMYFSTEWKATVTVPASLTGGLGWYDDVRYTTAYTNSLRLKGTNTTLASSVATNLATTPFSLLNLASGSGTIAGVFIATRHATDYSYLEAGFNAYLDGSGTAQYQTSGGEDFPGSAWYFNAQHTYQHPWSYLSNVGSTENNLDFATDLLALNGGIRFTNGVILKWERITAKTVPITTTVNIAYLCLYYQ